MSAGSTVRAAAVNLDNVNLSEMSRRTGISLSMLSHVFRGRRNPSLSSARLIAGELSRQLGYRVTVDGLIRMLPKTPGEAA